MVQFLEKLSIICFIGLTISVFLPLFTDIDNDISYIFCIAAITIGLLGYYFKKKENKENQNNDENKQ